MIKIYSITGVFKGILGDELKDIGDFSSQENGGNGKLTLSIKVVKESITFEIGDIVNYYKDNILIYSGNILEINQEENVSFNFIKLNIIGLAHFTANFSLNVTYNDTLANILIDIISRYNIERGQNILFLGNLPIDTGIYSVNLGDKNYLEYLKKLSEESGYNFYINDLGEVNFYEGETHFLIFGGNLESINSIQTSQIIKSKEIFNSIGIIVNLEYNFLSIKPLDKIKIQNNNKYKEIYKVAKISYGEEKATIQLENFISFTKLLGN